MAVSSVLDKREPVAFLVAGASESSHCFERRACIDVKTRCSDIPLVSAMHTAPGATTTSKHDPHPTTTTEVTAFHPRHFICHTQQLGDQICRNEIFHITLPGVVMSTDLCYMSSFVQEGLCTSVDDGGCTICDYWDAAVMFK